MARSQAIDTRLEKLIPAVEELFTSGALTQEEVRDVIRLRTQHEYRLVAKPLLLLDVKNAISFEMELEERVRRFCVGKKVILFHRWSIVERIESIYRIGLRHLRKRSEAELIRQELIAFLKKFDRRTRLSQLYAELMMKFPRRVDIWSEATMWEATAGGNIDNARTIVQQALVTMNDKEALWECALEVELLFANKLIMSIASERLASAAKRAQLSELQVAKERLEQEAAGNEPVRHHQRPQETVAESLKKENAVLTDIVLRLSLATAVVDEAFSSAASSPSLVERLASRCSAYPYSRDLVRHILSVGVAKALAVLALQSDTTQLARNTWESPKCGELLANLLRLEYLLGDMNVTCDVESFIHHKSQGVDGAPAVAVPVKYDLHFTGERRGLAAAAGFAGIWCTLSSATFWESPLAPQVGVLQECLVTLLRDAEARHLFTRAALSSVVQKMMDAAAPCNVKVLTTTLVGGSAMRSKSTRKSPTGAKQVVEELIQSAANMVNSIFGPGTGASEDAPAEGRKRARSANSISISAAHRLSALRWPQLISMLMPVEDVKLLKSAEGVARKDERAEGVLRIALEVVEQLNRLLEDLPRGQSAAAVVAGCFRSFGWIPKEEGDDPAATLLANPVKYQPGSTPLELWMVFASLERLLRGTASSTTTQLARGANGGVGGGIDSGSGSDSDAGETEQGGYSFASSGLVLRRCRTANSRAAPLSARHSRTTAVAVRQGSATFAEVGLAFLASVPHGSLTAAEAEVRCAGVYGLAVERLRSWNRAAEDMPLRDGYVMFLQDSHAICAATGEVQPTVKEVIAFCNKVVTECVPVPRQVLTQLTIPLLEALVVCGAKCDGSSLIQAARAEHERVIGVYRLSPAPATFTPLVYNCSAPKSKTEGANKRIPFRVRSDPAAVRGSTFSVPELNVSDWLSYVRFEEQVTKDLRHAREIAARARRETLDPQGLLIALKGPL